MLSKLPTEKCSRTSDELSHVRAKMKAWQVVSRGADSAMSPSASAHGSVHAPPVGRIFLSFDSLSRAAAPMFSGPGYRRGGLDRRGFLYGAQVARERRAPPSRAGRSYGPAHFPFVVCLFIYSVYYFSFMFSFYFHFFLLKFSFF